MKYLVFVFLTVNQLAFSADVKYPVSAIPDELKKNVNAVVREDKMTFQIVSKSNAIVKSRLVVTIMNEKGKHFAFFVLGYDKLIRINDMSGVVYNEFGNVIKRLKNSEIKDQSSFDGFSLFTDDRLKYVDLSQTSYPYTIEFEYEQEYKYLYNIAGTIIVPGPNVSVQHASYQITYPVELTPRFKTLNLGTTKAVAQPSKPGSESFLWTFENIAPMKFESMGPPIADLVPQILAAPGEFEYEHYKGNMSSWTEYGQWVSLINKGRDELPVATKKKIADLTRGLTTPEQKAKVLYEYLQSRTRYVSIQMGIGGHQPFPATVVDETGYGDCKALSNYMVAMLKEAGINSYYTLIKAGRGEARIMEDFPSSQFNHAIVAMPNGADTIWLECTSQTNPFGYQGTFTGDRNAFLITESGGKIVNTTRYNEATNRRSSTADVTIDKTGNAKAKISTSYNGLEYETDHLNFIVDNKSDDQKKWIQENTNIPSFDVNSFAMNTTKNKVPTAIVKLNLNLNRYASVSGKRFFVTPNLMDRSTFTPEKNENRKTAVFCKQAYTHTDTIVLAP